MYKIKPNGNYNLLIPDLGITLLPGNESTLLTDLEFENSTSIKNILHYLIVEKVDSVTNNQQPTIETKKEDILTNNNKTTFVARSQEMQQSEGVFVKDVELESQSQLIGTENVEKEIKEEVKIEIVNECTDEPIADEPVKGEGIKSTELQLEKTESEISETKEIKKEVVSKAKTEKKIKISKRKNKCSEN